ncbi:MAG: DUF1501 domain-containing protein [Candidatus Nanopelagicales bacterium]
MTDSHSCPEARRMAVSRRSLLRALGIGGAAVATSSMVDVRVAFGADAGWAGDTVVVLFLRGGFDGLSAVAPVGDPDYRTWRPTIAVPSDSAITLDRTFGLHPSLSALRPVWEGGDLAVVHAAGLANPNRSHFSAMDEMERAAPGSNLRTGWLDRTLGTHDAAGPFGAVQLGSSSIPFSLRGPQPELGMESLRSFSLNGADDATERARWRTALTSLHSDAPAGMAASATGTLAALDTTATLIEQNADPAHGAVYPDTGLGGALRDAARLIAADIGVRVITIDEGDWDMHADLGPVDYGWMHDKLADLGGSLAAFATDLGPRLDQVTLVTMSEFGRRVEQNESGGVDHGWGNCMFVLGGHVVTGVHGAWPTLAPDRLTEGDLTATTDYRAVLADVLANRTGASVEQIRTVFPGYTGETLGVTSA